INEVKTYKREEVLVPILKKKGAKKKNRKYTYNLIISSSSPRFKFSSTIPMKQKPTKKKVLVQ
ncbi:10111_t:CDS:1, partial [Scutellospora calospora]